MDEENDDENLIKLPSLQEVVGEVEIFYAFLEAEQKEPQQSGSATPKKSRTRFAARKTKKLETLLSDFTLWPLEETNPKLCHVFPFELF